MDLPPSPPSGSIPFARTEGFLTKMFGRRDAAFFIESLLKVNVRDVFVYGNVPGWNNALMVSNPSINDGRYVAFAHNNQPLWLLDIIPQPMDHVVPQTMWTPPNQSDWRRYVEQASLRMPVFFIQNDGTIGLPLVRALSGQRALLRCGDMPAPLGGGHSTQIRIAVSAALSPPLQLSPSTPPFFFPFLRLSFWLKTWLASQWPGYDSWERQIQIRDQTRQRNEITLERFVKLVAGVVDRFLTV